jgi:hypothetical protein
MVGLTESDVEQAADIIALVGADLCVCPNQTNVFDERGAIHEMGLPHEMGAHAGAPLPKMILKHDNHGRAV